MNEKFFLTTHSATWHQLENYCLRLHSHGTKSLSSQEIKDFLNLFKLTSHHLAYAQTHYKDSRVVPYLNNLVSQCHTFIYAVPKVNLFSSFKSLLHDYHNLLAQYKAYILFACFIFLCGGFLSFFMIYLNPSNAPLFLDPDTIESISNQSTSGPIETWNYPMMSSYIMVNNITVALKAFVLGITFGIGTAYVLFNNGLMLGSFTALFYLYGQPLSYWSLILPHGVMELSAIFIAGGAGFILAKSLLIPGPLMRKYSLIQGGRQSLRLMGGVILLLIIAGLIEGFFTPLPISVDAKLLFAFLTALLLVFYCIFPSSHHV